MEILLLEDVNGIGRKNDLLVVGDGFALNYLLPQRKALVATPTVRKRYADQITKRALEKEKERQAQQNVASALAGKTIVLARKAAKNGKLYASITEDQIVEALKDQLAVTIAAEQIRMDEHIKATGITQVKVKMGDQSYSVTISVQPEQPKGAAPKAEAKVEKTEEKQEKPVEKEA